MTDKNISDFDPMVSSSLDEAQKIIRETENYDRSFNKIYRKVSMNIPVHRLRAYYTANLLSKLAEREQKKELEELYDKM